jgi:Tfp pilus assembly protein PilF
MLAVAAGLAMTALLVIATQRAQPAGALAIEHVELWQRPLVAADALLFYLRKLVWPWPLGPDYGRTPSVALESLIGKLAWLGLAAFVAAIYWLPGRRVAWTALAIFAAALAPVSGLLSFGFQGMSTVADRYLYLGMLAPALLLAWGLSRGAPRAAWVTAGAVIAGLAAFSFWQTSLWHDDGTLFAHNLERVNAKSHVAFNNLGYALQRRAVSAPTPAEKTALLQTAATHFDRARQLRPEMDEAWQRLAYAQRQLGQLPEAEATFRQFLAQRPKSPTGHYNLGTLLAQQHRAAEAIAEFRAAIALRPDYANAWLELALQLAAERDGAGALEAFQQALATGRTSRAIQVKGHLGLAELQLALGNRSAAIEAAQVAAQLAPQLPAVQSLIRRLQEGEARP